MIRNSLALVYNIILLTISFWLKYYSMVTPKYNDNNTLAKIDRQLLALLFSVLVKHLNYSFIGKMVRLFLFTVLAVNFYINGVLAGKYYRFQNEQLLVLFKFKWYSIIRKNKKMWILVESQSFFVETCTLKFNKAKPGLFTAKVDKNDIIQDPQKGFIKFDSSSGLDAYCSTGFRYF